MNPTLRRILVPTITGLLCFGPVSCKPEQAGSSILTTVVGGRHVRAVIDGPASIQSMDDAAIVSTGSRKIVIEKERVLMNGIEMGKVPAAAAKVEITVSGGKLVVAADGVSIVTTDM